MTKWAILLLLLPIAATAGGIKNDNRSSAAAESVSQSNNSIHDSSNAVGLGLGDVDINDCYRSYQVVVLWQGTQLNWWCVAREYDAIGLHEVAAQVRCDKIKGISKLFDDQESCIAANTLVAKPQSEVLPAAQENIFEDDEEEFHVEQQELYEDLRAKIQNLEHAQDREKARRRAAAEEAAKRQAEQQAYAEELLKELEEWK